MEKLVLVHLSDIHFTKWSGTTAHDLDADVRNELLRDASKVTKEIGAATGILVTGDIAFSGQQAEYERAAYWLLELCQALGCPEENVWVVPGNHDVDRKVAGSKVTRSLHEGIRSKGEISIDSELREIFSDPQSASALLAPLAEYNKFAARFQCSISAEKPFWERDLALDCGTVIRLRGLCSTLVSNAHDEKGNIVLGAAQASVPRIDGVEYLTLCHHPPDWLRDQDGILNHLESKVRIQLFGHKHSQRVQMINRTLRLTAGAMHPERNERDWIPTYNIIEITRRDDERIGVRLFQRRWHQIECRFVAENASNSGKDHHDYVWQDCPRPAPRQAGQTPEARKMTRAEVAVSDVVAAKTTAKEREAMPTPNYQRRLTYRFLTLPFRHQFAIAESLNVLTDEDGALSSEILFREVFKRAASAGLLAKLWNETEKRHPDPADFNPFDGSN
ncbi:metallophosphoesterase [Sorangium sp. So ce1182]|uniref:metallophosphoesterase n=1 Tax=Sorangium sp. So ce1182 TaxID=3133334 RepID=UPI003F629A34